MIFRRPQRSEWDAAAQLLTAAHLPLAGVREHFADFLGVWSDDRLLGLAGLEVYGEDALVRSVVISDQAQGRGLGQELVQRILVQGYAAGVRRFGLLTTTAADFFPRFGFVPVRGTSGFPACIRRVPGRLPANGRGDAASVILTAGSSSPGSEYP